MPSLSLASASTGYGSRQDWPEYCLFILAWFPPSLRHLPLVWSQKPFARPGHGLFCIPLGRVATRAVVLHHSHTSYPLYAGRDIVEVLTKCRAEHLLRGKNPFVAAGVRTKRTIGSAKAR